MSCQRGETRLHPAAAPPSVSPSPLMCFIRNKSQAGFHESVFCSLQALRDKEFSAFDETVKRAR